MGKGQDLYKKAKTLIPGGTSLLSKRPEQLLPENWPAYYSKSKGCKVWDLDGREYILTTTQKFFDFYENKEDYVLINQLKENMTKKECKKMDKIMKILTDNMEAEQA